jgi:HSP20 family protein
MAAMTSAITANRVLERRRGYTPVMSANAGRHSREVDQNAASEQTIPLNAYETTQALVVVAPMPGVQPDDVDVVIDGDCLVLESRLRTDAPKDYVIHEWDYGNYRRSEPIAEGYGAPVTARMGNGQLVVTLTRGGDRPAGGRIEVHPD